MILDVLANSHLYGGLPRLAAGLAWLQNTDLDGVPLGKTVLDGDRLFALVQEYTPKPATVGKFEAHRRYWDIQYVARGIERMGWNTLARMTVSESHSDERDVAFFHGPGDFFLVPAGSFAIFGPHDVHMPGVALEQPHHSDTLVRKIVLKVEM
ncbi:MAG: YhcH/YjgK/YiaL family protein [Pirellulaceae bacterium]|nr:YhcH/YjgK/YiaL family protein [Pirellulaceae bacterium]